MNTTGQKPATGISGKDTQARHTPGPWSADKDGFIRAAKGKINVAVDTRMAMGTNVAYACGDHIRKSRKGCLDVEPRITANTFLIAAAPELLAKAVQVREALRQIVTLGNVNKATRKMLIHCGNALNDAIAKAEGRT